jgi:hypothetical protein
MSNPYATKSNHAFWANTIRTKRSADVLSLPTPKFSILPTDKIAVAGSCFAQHLARGFSTDNQYILNLEPEVSGSSYSREESQLFSARYGNIYSSRQLLQLFQRAHGLFEPLENVWRLKNGRYVDPFRHRIPVAGFAAEETVAMEMANHLDAVQKMFRECSIFIFTIGLTEIWRSRIDGAVVPSPPGVLDTAQQGNEYEFHNLDIDEVRKDLETFIGLLRKVNPKVRVILTVSPVPLAATFTENHIICANTYSKAILRLAVEQIVQTYDFVDYFPSYERITSRHHSDSAFMENQRTVRPEAVQEVIGGFVKRYFNSVDACFKEMPRNSHLENAVTTMREPISVTNEFDQVPCDEELFGGARDV